MIWNSYILYKLFIAYCLLQYVQYNKYFRNVIKQNITINRRELIDKHIIKKMFIHIYIS